MASAQVIFIDLPWALALAMIWSASARVTGTCSAST